ncbi:MAG TPA: hypothetical protein VMG10_11070 [Gemmataceae bacterium]|nr:hypothetical protein [Gemmataceae bacterium]
MATTYKSTIEINVWKEHVCIGCKSRFRYLFERKKTGQGRTPEAASLAARKAIRATLVHEVDLQPCPGCGLYQPDMVGRRRLTRHGWTIAACSAALLLIMILLRSDVLLAGTAALAAAAACAVLGLVHLLIDLNNPNRDLESNQQLAQQKVERGDLWVPPGSKAEPVVEIPAFGWSPAHVVAYVLFGLGVLAVVSPELLRTMYRWPVNRACYPHIVGPGDAPYIYFPNKITSIKGYWQGNIQQVEVLNAAEVGLESASFSTVTNQDSWDSSISIGSEESKTSSDTLWVRVYLPNDPWLEGKTLKLKMKLIVVYPRLNGNNVEEVSESYSHTEEIRLSSAEARHSYKIWCWNGFLCGVQLIAVSSLLLVRLSKGLCKLAKPTSIFAPDLGDEEPQENEAPEVLPAGPPRRDDGGITRRD